MKNSGRRPGQTIRNSPGHESHGTIKSGTQVTGMEIFPGQYPGTVPTTDNDEICNPDQGSRRYGKMLSHPSNLWQPGLEIWFLELNRYYKFTWMKICRPTPVYYFKLPVNPLKSHFQPSSPNGPNQRGRHTFSGFPVLPSQPVS